MNNLESLVADAVDRNSLTKRIRGEHWTPTMQRIHDSVLSNSKIPVEAVINHPYVPRSGKRHPHAGVTSLVCP